LRRWRLPLAAPDRAVGRCRGKESSDMLRCRVADRSRS
jgi:hypothetical protein